MHPGAINPVPVSFSVPSGFVILGEVVMEGTGNVLVEISRKSRQRARHHIEDFVCVCVWRLGVRGPTYFILFCE